MQIEEIHLRGVWSFGREDSSLVDIGSRAILIGRNNVGKSNILRGVRWFIANRVWLQAPGTKPNLGDYSPHVPLEGDAPTSGDFRVKLKLRNADVRRVLSATQGSQQLKDIVQPLLIDGVTLRVSTTWDPATATSRCITLGAQEGYEFLPNVEQTDPKLNEWKGHGGRTCREALISLIETGITYISGWRSFQQSPAIIQELKKMQAPIANQGDLINQFGMISDFFRDLTGLKKATLHIDEQNHINVSIRPRYLPIESFGDGIAHLLILAFYFARHTHHIFLIEEPETHIHPELQRHLIRYVRRLNNGNQYIITTHSPVLIDSLSEATTFRIELDGGSTRIERCHTEQDLCRVLDALDLRASDILQANLVIWVEGPTDRMFLNHCLKLLNPSLTEGIHYQILCYGGKLLSHLTMAEDERDLINILKLSRNAVVVCDRDTESIEQPIGETKARLQKDCEALGAMFWLTAGRELENYFSDQVLSSTYAELMKEPGASITLGQFDSLHAVIERKWPNPPTPKWRAQYLEHKSRIFPWFLKHLGIESLKHLNLKESLDALVLRITKANSYQLELGESNMGS